ncbi:hypothetical protein F2Q68_00044338 [Brassica cretica]|uniref:Uncharacterized protein n=2 Tax=Brassica cretica TaxID=69181 RepID=A0A8S9LH95_BRACR|nr:hypothetical protein F2Q68_00044338 [Brassica cretica]KAF3516718.1 hypothetical protein DY000_02060412 [Brassica cretica]
MNAPLIGFDHCWQHPKHPPEPENTRKWSGMKRDGRIPLSKAWKFKGRDEQPLYGSYHYWRNGAHGLSRAVHDQDPYGPDAPDVRARLIGSIGTLFHGRLGAGRSIWQLAIAWSELSSSVTARSASLRVHSARAAGPMS